MSSLNVISVFSLILTLNSIECQSEEMCEFVRPNGTYEGMGLHKEYKFSGKSESFLSNKKGVQWKFELSGEHKHLKLLPGEYRPFNESLFLKFGIYIEFGWRQWFWANCYVEKRDLRTVSCVRGHGPWAFINDSVVDSLVFRGYAYYNNQTYYTVVLHRKDKTILFLRYDGKIREYVDKCLPEERCPDMRFIDQMDHSLILQLDGVIDFNFGKKNSGFWLLFNIKGRPMYCIQMEGQNLSEGCQSVGNLSLIFEKCFQEEDEEVSTQLAVQIKSPTDPLVWVLIFELILMVILVMACNYVIGKRRKRLIEGPINSVTSRSYHPSQDEQSQRARVAALLNAT